MENNKTKRKDSSHVKEYHVPALEKGLAILEYMATTGGGSFNEICSALGISRTTVFSILRNLIDMGYVIKDENGDYCSSLKLYGLGMQVIRRLNPTETFIPEMTALRDELGYTVHLLASGNSKNSTLLERLDGTGGVYFKSYIGMSKPLHLSGAGKAILAFLPEEDFNFYCSGKLEVYTKNSMSTVEQLIASREEIRRRGFSVDNEEGEPGVFCFGAPIFASGGNIFGGVSISMLTTMVNEQNFERNSRRIMQAGKNISLKMGYSGPYPPVG